MTIVENILMKLVSPLIDKSEVVFQILLVLYADTTPEEGLPIVKIAEDVKERTNSIAFIGELRVHLAIDELLEDQDIEKYQSKIAANNGETQEETFYRITERGRKETEIRAIALDHKPTPTKLEQLFSKFVVGYRFAVLIFGVIALVLHFFYQLEFAQSAWFFGLVVPVFSFMLLWVQCEKIFAWHGLLKTEEDARVKIAIYIARERDTEALYQTLVVLLVFGICLIIVSPF